MKPIKRLYAQRSEKEKSTILDFLRNPKFIYILKSKRLKILDIRAFKNFMQIRKSQKRKLEKIL
jgi:hypothetical protein